MIPESFVICAFVSRVNVILKNTFYESEREKGKIALVSDRVMEISLTAAV